MQLRGLAIALLLVSGGTPHSAGAQQVDFKRVSRSGDELLSYRWRDSEKREYATAFTLTKAQLLPLRTQ